MKKVTINKLTAISLLFIATSANATLFTDVSAHVGDNRISRSNVVTTPEVSGSEITLSGVSSSVTSAASSTYGSLKVFTFGGAAFSGIENLSSPELRGSANARFTDSLTLVNTVHEGKMGVMEFRIYNKIIIDTMSPLLGVSRANYGFLLGISNGGDISTLSVSADSRTNFFDSSTTSNYSANGNFSVSSDGYYFNIRHEFIFGTSLTIDAIASAGGILPDGNEQIDVPSTGRFLVDSSNSTYWGGIQSIKIDGIDVTEYELVSESGTDYSRSFVPNNLEPNPVTEPGTFLLFAISVALLLSNGRRRNVIRSY